MAENKALAPAEQGPPQIAAPPAHVNPFQRQAHESLAHGAVAIESERAIAEAQGKLVIAKRFPRDQHHAWARAMEVCQRPGLAEAAFYSYNRGGQTVSGPSIRLAEELARCWGNLDYGMRELSNTDGVSEMEAYAWDLETNTISKQQFTVRHIRDTRSGGKALTDQRDIYELGANMGARRMRARILAILPADLVEAAVDMCRRTIAARDKARPMSDRIREAIFRFGQLGVNAAHLETYLGHALDATTPDELADLHGVYTAIREGHSRVSDFFGAPKLEAPAPEAPPPAQQQPPQQQQRGKRSQKAAAAPKREPQQQRPTPAQAQQEPAQEAQKAPPVQPPASAPPANQPPQVAEPMPEDLF